MESPAEAGHYVPLASRTCSVRLQPDTSRTLALCLVLVGAEHVLRYRHLVVGHSLLVEGGGVLIPLTVGPPFDGALVNVGVDLWVLSHELPFVQH